MVTDLTLVLGDYRFKELELIVATANSILLLSLFALLLFGHLGGLRVVLDNSC